MLMDKGKLEEAVKLYSKSRNTYYKSIQGAKARKAYVEFRQRLAEQYNCSVDDIQKTVATAYAERNTEER